MQSLFAAPQRSFAAAEVTERKGTWEEAAVRPTALLAHADPGFLRAAAALSRRIGVDLVVARSAREARRLALLTEPEVVLLDALLADESGYLACAKIKNQLPESRIILLAEERTAEVVRYALFAGAEAVYHRAMKPEALVDLVLAMTVQAGG
jgi:DNA-binding NarL/FixJ family response regulator